MILIDGKSITKGLAARLVTTQVRTVLQRIAVLLKPTVTAPPAPSIELVPAATADEPRNDAVDAELSLRTEDTQPVVEALQLEPPYERAPAANGAAIRTLTPLTSEQIDTILTLELTDETPAVVAAPAPEPVEPSAPAAVVEPTTPPPSQPKSRRERSKGAARAPQPEPAIPEKRIGPAKDLALSVQQLLKLRSGGRTRRYEVLLRARNDAERNELPHTLVQRATKEIGEAALDEFVLTELLGFLAAHRSVWEAEPTSFSVNLSASAVSDEGFAQIVEALLERSGVAPECLGFEIPQSCCVHEPVHVERFANACDKLGCFIVLDDFTLDPRAVPLLRSKTLKLVKIDPKLTTAAMKDRVSQALVVAIAQASKVLGVHCVAKRVESQATRQWLSATGIDFAQGFALEGPQALESLIAPEKTTPEK
ncbi:MAG: EAL domain-containing protein, partial [Gammaproteobacteria bacterium]